MRYYYSALGGEWYSVGRFVLYDGRPVRVVAPLEEPERPGKIWGVFVRWSSPKRGRFHQSHYAHIPLTEVQPYEPDTATPGHGGDTPMASKQTQP